ncbi:MAG: hypothetical protein ACREMM_08270 [Gemmatimonadales bacterium]
MLCRRCAQLALTAGAVLRAWVLRAALDDSPGEGVLCVGCGAMLPPEELTERLVLKLSQLAQFGLGGGMAPLLRASPQAFEDV